MASKTTKKNKNPKKLKFKLQLIIAIVLFIQIAIISTLSLFLFHQQISRNADINLEQDLDQTGSSLESLKKTLFNRIYLLRYSIEQISEENLNQETLYDKIYTHFNTMQTDQAVLLSEEEEEIFHMENNEINVSSILHTIDLSQFDFIKSRYMLHTADTRKLFLVTGTKVYHPSGKRYYVLLINALDNDFANNIYKQTGINFVLFQGNQPICSVVPNFHLPEGTLSDIKEVQIGSTPYKIKSQLISSDVPGGLKLTVLRSNLQDYLYIRWLNTILIISFLVTLIMTLSYIVGVTNRILSPFYELYNWLSNYLSTGETKELYISQKDGEIEFLSRTIYSMVQKLIKEEQIIRKQFHEISFLNKYNNEIMDNLQAGVLILDTHERVDFCNDYLRDLLTGSDVSDITGMHYQEFFSTYFVPEGDWSQFPKIDFKKNFSYLLNVKKHNNTTIKLSLKISYLDENEQTSRVLIVFEDITDTERLWNKILITEKVSSLGLLSAGMAHELNNPLGSIQSHINYLKAVETDEEKQDSILWVESETKRMASIVQRVLTFSNSHDSESNHTDLHSVIYDVIELSKFSIKEKYIEIKKDLGEDPIKARIPKNEAKQVFLNLFINAAQSIENHGRITITAYKIHDTIHVYLKDTGHGISEKDVKDIFNPFFSTKTTQDSNGLGLSIVYNILRRAGGDIHIHSEENEGTLVEVLLPVYTEEVEENNEYTHY